MFHAVVHPHPNRSAELTAEALPHQGGGGCKVIGQPLSGDLPGFRLPAKSLQHIHSIIKVKLYNPTIQMGPETT
jgi:hypothetical protein